MRKSAYMKNESCLIDNFTIKIKPLWNVFATYTNSLTIQKKKTFDSLPKKLLETFRIINFTTPEFVFIIRGFLVIMGVENAAVMAKKIVLFFDIVVNNISNKICLLKNEIEKNDDKKSNFLSCLKRTNFSQVIKIISKANENLTKMVKNTEHSSIEKEIMKEIKIYFKTIVSSNHLEEVLKTMELIFGDCFYEDKTSKNKEKSEIIRQNLKKFETKNGLVHSKKFFRGCKILLEVLESTNVVFVCGKSSSSKSTLIKACAFLTSSLNGINFFMKYLLSFLDEIFTVHQINLDSLTYEYLIQSEKNQSIFDKLFMKCLTDGEKKELIDFTTLQLYKK